MGQVVLIERTTRESLHLITMEDFGRASAPRTLCDKAAVVGGHLTTCGQGMTTPRCRACMAEAKRRVRNVAQREG